MKRKKFIKVLLVIGGIFLILVLAAALWMNKEYRRFYSNDPLVWKKEISVFKKEDKKREHPDNAVLFVGSSSIRFWKTLEADMLPIPVIQRGFGGSKINDILYWAPEIILNYQVKAIVIFAGTNDITGSDHDTPPEEVAKKVEELESLIHQNLKNTRVFYISITPTPDRWDVWKKAKLTNDLLKTFAAETENFEFLDFTADFLLPDGTPNSELFRMDGLHPNKQGYAIWTEKIKVLLL